MGRRAGLVLSRQIVLDTAVAVAAEVGPEGFSSRAVADRLGIQAPSMYHYFESHDALRHAVAVETWRRMLTEMPTDAADLGVFMRGCAHAYRAFAVRNRQLYRFAASISLDPTEVGLADFMAGVLKLPNSMGLYHADAVHALRGLRSMLVGYVQLELEGHFKLGTSIDESFSWITDVVIDGVTGRLRGGR